MPSPSPLVFRVTCRACYGTEVWRHDRIVRTLTDAGILPPSTETDVEQLAKLFVANSEQLTCSGCGKKHVLLVQRIYST